MYGVTDEVIKEWQSKHEGDPYIEALFKKLKEIHKMIFDSETGDGTIEHLRASMMPKGMTEEIHIKIFRKQLQFERH